MPELQRGDGVLAVDVQNDFCPGGALAVEEGDQVVAVLNRWIDDALAGEIPVYFSRDWHPERHPSFQQQGGPWPVHCLQDTPGAGFHPDLHVPDKAVKVSKGVRFDRDQYSAFDETGLIEELGRAGVKRLWVGGLAQDVCVRATCLDARRAGLEVRLLSDATRPVSAGEAQKALQEMREAGVRVV